MMDKSMVPAYCFIFNSTCRGADCPAHEYIPEGEACAIGLEPGAIEAVKDAMVKAARYIDEKLNIDKESGEDLLSQVRRAIEEGKVDWAGVMEDLANLDS